MTVTVTPRKGRPSATGKSHPAVGSRVGVPSGLKKGWSSREVTVLLTDLRGFSAIADSISGRDMLAVLNRYLTKMCEIAIANGGSIDKFIGDAVMVLFGAPHRLASHARRAVTCALQMQLAMDEINRDNEAMGLPHLYMGAGINTGRVLAGLLGSVQHYEYTVVGDEVNLASRIESLSLRGQVLISEATFLRCKGFVTARTPMDVYVKGKPKPVRVREVEGIPALGLSIPRRTLRRSPRVEVKIPFTCRMVVDKIVMPRIYKGLIHDIGYQGIRAEIKHALKDDADIVLEFKLSLTHGHERNIYGKVRHVHHKHGHRVAGIEFTSISQRVEEDIRYYVQLAIQGTARK